MKHISIKETSEKWDIASQLVNYYGTAGRIEGAQKVGSIWAVTKGVSVWQKTD